MSRDWSDKTLAEHKADRAEVVRAALAEAGMPTLDADRWSADQTGDDGTTPRYRWEPAGIDPASGVETYRRIMHRTLAERLRWQSEYEAAKALRSAARPPNDTRSATQPEPALSGI